MFHNHIDQQPVYVEPIVGLYNKQLTAQDRENLRNSNGGQSTTNTGTYSPIVNNTVPQNQYWDWQNNKPNYLYGYKCDKNPKRRMK